MSVYKPMTPSLRRKIFDAYDMQMAELSECEDNSYTRMIKSIYEVQKNILTSLPDGYLLPFKE